MAPRRDHAAPSRTRRMLFDMCIPQTRSFGSARLAAVEGDALGVLPEPHERVSEVRLPQQLDRVLAHERPAESGELGPELPSVAGDVGLVRVLVQAIEQGSIIGNDVLVTHSNDHECDGACTSSHLVTPIPMSKNSSILAHL